MPLSWTSPGTAELMRGVMQGARESMCIQDIYEAVRDRITGSDVGPIHMPGINDSRAMAGKPGYKPPSYESIKVMMHACRRLGLVTLDREELNPAKPHLFAKRFYTLNPAMISSPYWRNPRAALRDPAEFARMTEFRIRRLSGEDWMSEIRRRKRR